MTFIKKLGLGTWISCAVVLLALVGMIIYAVALSSGTGLVIASGSDLFYDMARESDAAMPAAVTTCGIIAIVALVVAIVLGQIKAEGAVGSVIDVVASILRMAAPALLIITFLFFIYGSLTGIGWTYFSNEELEIYAEAKAVGASVITGLVFFFIAAIAAIVAAFQPLAKKDA